MTFQLFKKKKKTKKPEVLVSSSAKFWVSPYVPPYGGHSLPASKCTLYGNKELHVARGKKIKKLDLSKVSELIRHTQDHFCLVRASGDVHLRLCDELHSYIDWFFELTDIMPGILVKDMSMDTKPKKLSKTSAEKYICTTIQKFNKIPVLLIKDTGVQQKGYLITKTLKKGFDVTLGFDKVSGKIQGAQGKIRAAMALTGDKLCAVKELRYDIKPADGTHKHTGPIDPKDMMKEMKTMKICKCRLKIHDVLEIDRKAYCVIDYMEGTLTEYEKWAHRSTTNLKKDEDKWIGRFILKELALDLRQCHKAGYAHSDIKPDNVLVTKNRVALADYGLANKGGKHLCGTPNYLTAWNFEQNKVDKPLDVYNIGLSWLFYMMRGHLLSIVKVEADPYSARTKIWSLYKKKKKKIKTPSLLPPRILEFYYTAAVPFAYFHEFRYDRKGELKKKLPKDLTWWQPVEDRLAEVRARDPELYQFVWERMLTQDPKKRATAEDVHKTLTTLLKNVPQSVPFNRVLNQSIAGSRRESLRKALKEAQMAAANMTQWTKKGSGVKVTW
jgi:serine/threonine protein kinase